MKQPVQNSKNCWINSGIWCIKRSGSDENDRLDVTGGLDRKELFDIAYGIAAQNRGFQRLLTQYHQ
jgi:hypothetical protein